MLENIFFNLFSKIENGLFHFRVKTGEIHPKSATSIIIHEHTLLLFVACNLNNFSTASGITNIIDNR